MSPPVTEIAYLSIATSTTIEDPASPEGKAWNENLDVLHAQDGCQKCRWGRSVEDPSTVQLFIDWDSVGHHEKFIASPAYKPFFDKYTQMLQKPAHLFHAEFKPFPPSAAFGSPVTELITAFFPASVSADVQAKFTENAGKFLKVSESAHDGFKDATAGWVVEQQDNEKVEGKKAKAYVAAIGWPSIDAHKAFRETQVFKDNIWLLGEGVADSEMHHIKVHS